MNRDFLDDEDLNNMPIPGSSFNVGTNSSTIKMGGAGVPSMPLPSATMPQQAPMMPPAAPPMAQNVPQGTMPPPPAAQIPGMAEILAQANAQGRGLYGQYTPEKRNELYSMMAERSNSMPNAIGAGLASVGDAIARGYGRDQTNFLDKTLQSQKTSRDEALGAFDTAQKGSMALTQAGLEIGKMDPSSPMSKMAQEAYGGPLQKLGYTPEQIAKMPASQIESVTQVALKYGDIQSQKELKEATLELQTLVANANIGNQKLQRAKDAADVQRNAATETLKRGENARVLGVPIPFTSKVPGKLRDKATNVLERQMEGDLGVAGGAFDHPQAAAAEKWARENPNDPRAGEILKRIGK